MVDQEEQSNQVKHEEQQYEEIQLKYVSEMHKTDLEESFLYYQKYMNLYTYLRVTMLGMGVLVLLYNIFIAGNSYPISTYDNIMTGVISVCGLVVFVLVVISVLAFRQQGKIRKILKEFAEQRNFDYKELKNEYNIVIKSLYGGTGI
ncbi:hypothetical protein [Fulvivirga sediminis]|uniref:Uncharacterized protein n=1 Tax=Fulvivirga sediminis TaxID=2803949 RepID=A0A937F809_9BACT|nr:hypothetical protein [Fulvivirga sediminis]MBL3655984.1 hypothetical protein [Fulvivirga sediminis]